MNYSTAVFLINDAVRAVVGIYDPDVKTAPKAIFKTMDQSLRPGDYVIVPTDTRHLMTVFKITDVDVDVDFDSVTPLRWVIGKVDRDQYETILSQEADAIAVMKSAEKTKKRNEMRAAMMADTEALKDMPITVLGSEARALPGTPGQS